MKIDRDRATVVDERAPTAQETEAQVETVEPVATVRSVTTAPFEGDTVRTTRSNLITPTAIVAGAVAIALMVIGGITAARAGIDSTLDEPVVEVAGFTATALLGLIEFGFGLLLLLATLSRQPKVPMFFGIVGGVAALIAVFEPSIGDGSLAIERGFAVIVAIAMAAIVVSALLPTIQTRSTTSRTRAV